MIKRYGNAPQMGRRYTRRPGVYAVLLDRDGLLVTHQAAPTPEFQLPGGGIDPGEHPIAALHREVMEETGWHIAGLRRLGAFFHHAWPLLASHFSTRFNAYSQENSIRLLYQEMAHQI